MATAVSPPAPVHEEIAAILNVREQELFDRFAPSDQWHGYRVYRALREAGHMHPGLLAAALLHDVGKTRVLLRIWERSLVVLTRKLWPGKVAAWGQGEARGWKRPFVVKVSHPAWGAEMAQQAGSHPLVVSLIRRHQEPLPETAVTEEDQLLACLQWADDQN